MPSKNSRKIYVKNGFYHAYNRGVDKREIFSDKEDYFTLIRYFTQALTPPKENKDLKTEFTIQGAAFEGVKRQPKNFHNKITLMTYCLMPNHYHLILKQNSKNTMKEFLQSIFTRYSMYYNKKHRRIGTLFQDHYKAVLIQDERYLLHLSRYIHLNPSDNFSNLASAYSSYAEYLGKRKTNWVKADIILSYFNQKIDPSLKNINSYKYFVEGYEQDSATILGDLTLD